jgi:nicotinamide mononucleotide transporter
MTSADLLMSEFLSVTLEQALANSWLEIIAVVMGVAYLLLAMRENILCWYAAFISTLLFLIVFWDVKLYMESGLQLYYLAMAVYGWYKWRQGENNTTLSIKRWPLNRHLLIILGTVIVSGVSGYGLATQTDATTYMVATKVLENWLYWFVLDALSIYLYLDRGLYFAALLFAAYLIIVIFGFLQWNRRYLQQTQS